MEFIDIINEEKEKPYFKKLEKFILNEYETKTIYPDKALIFNALKLTPFNKVKVVLIGQDPYYSPNFANGLAFSVNDNIEIPKSLNNIYKEINNELNLPIPTTGNLTPLAKHGVLLLNRILTVEKDKPLSHKNIGWEEFTLRIIQELNKRNEKTVFILLGNEAKSLTKYLNNPHHLVLTSSHPSPLGAYHGFFGSGIFKQTIEFLDETADFWRI